MPRKAVIIIKPIRIFDENINLLAEISNYESLMFTRSWHGVGDLELRINRYKNYTDTLQKGNIIVIGNEKHKCYKILHREIELDEQGKVSENWLIKGLELKSVAGQRITIPPSHVAYDNRSGSAETVMKHYINNNLVSPADPKRKIDQLVIAPNLSRGSHVNWQSRFKNVSEELTDISMLSGIGWFVSVDYQSKKWVFDVKNGRDLTVNQAVNNPVIFSPEFDNIKHMYYVDSDLNHRNVAYVAGQGEGVERRVVELGESVGLSRYELFVDARDVAEKTEDDQPVERPEDEIIADLRMRGQKRLVEMDVEEFLEAQIMTPIKRTENGQVKVFSTFMYEHDYDLGDIVTVQNKGWGITTDTRITEVTEIYDNTGFHLEATFGNSRPTLISRIKQELEQMGGEVRRWSN